MDDSKIKMAQVTDDRYDTLGSADSFTKKIKGEVSVARTDSVPVAPEIIRNMTPEHRAVVEQRLKRKIDTRLMPAVVVMYLLNYIDRNNIASARLGGIEKDLSLSTWDFNTAVSILFAGYVLMQLPSNMFLNKIGKPAIYLPTVMIIWGLISTLTAACTNASGLWAVRFFLGFVEAAYFPGCIYWLSCWYTRKELGFRTAILFSGNLMAGAFSGLITAGIAYGMDGTMGLRSWRWMFIIEGVATMVIAMGGYFIVPNFPRTTSWLTEEEAALAAWRLQEDIGEEDWISSGEQTIWTGAKMAFTDRKTYVLMLMEFGVVAAGSYGHFFPTVVATLQYNNVVSLLLTSPPHVLAVMVCLWNCWHADKTGERFWHIAIPMMVSMSAFIVSATTTGLALRYCAIMVMPIGASAIPVILSWISNTLPRPPAKRAAALAMVNAASNVSSMYTSYLYPTSAGPQYVMAWAHNSTLAFVAIMAALALRFMLKRLNKRLERGEYVEGAINSGGFRFRY